MAEKVCDRVECIRAQHVELGFMAAWTLRLLSVVWPCTDSPKEIYCTRVITAKAFDVRKLSDILFLYGQVVLETSSS